MLEFRLKQPNALPIGRTPKLNRAHPLFSQQHFTTATVAQGGSLVDLVTGVSGTNTTTLGGNDQFGQYIWSNDSAGTAAVAMGGSGATFNVACWGCIFRLSGTNRQFVYTVTGGNSGIFTNGLAVNYFIANGSQSLFNGVADHVYFAFQNNIQATAALQRTFVLVDLTTGQVQTAQNASSANVALNAIAALTVNLGVCTNRLYCTFACGSALPNTPTTWTPAPTFYSIDQIMSGIKDPWGLWYA